MMPFVHLFHSESLWKSFALQLSFQMWTDQIQETLNSKKRGDAAFRAKDFPTAIECYTHVSHLFNKCLIKMRYIIYFSDSTKII